MTLLNEFKTETTEYFREMTNNAGILPIVIKNNVVHLLLGKETTSGRWSTFSGKQEEGEDFVTTALREFHEETANTFPYVTKDFVTEFQRSCLDSRTPTGKAIKLYLVDFSFCNQTQLSTENFAANRRGSITEYEKEKTELRWVTLGEVTKLRLRYCFFKDLPKIIKEINSTFNI